MCNAAASIAAVKLEYFIVPYIGTGRFSGALNNDIVAMIISPEDPQSSADRAIALENLRGFLRQPY